MGTTPDQWTETYDLNDTGERVGVVDGEAVLLDPTDEVHELGVTTFATRFLEGPRLALNEAGDVAGTARSSGGDPYAFRWSRPEGTVALPGGESNQASAINDLGIVVGAVYEDLVLRPAAWQDDSPTLLRLPEDAVGGSALGINNHNDVVGVVEVSALTLRAALWRDGLVHYLDEHAEAPGWEIQLARDVNDAGRVLVDVVAVDDPVGWRQPAVMVPECADL